MTKLKSVGKIENPKPGDSDTYYGEFGNSKSYEEGFSHKLSELQEKSDFVIVTVKGKKHFTANVNYCGGVCDDCCEFDCKDISKAEGFVCE